VCFSSSPPSFTIHFVLTDLERSTLEIGYRVRRKLDIAGAGDNTVCTVRPQLQTADCQHFRELLQRSAEVAAQKRLAQLEKDIEETEALITKAQETMADPDVCGDYEKLSELSAEITRLEELLQGYYEQLDEML